MANEYATLAELKGERRVTKTTGDTLLQQKLTAASRAIDRKTSRRFWLDPDPTVHVYNPRGRVVPDPDGERLLVDDIGSETGLIVEVGSGSSWTAVTDYETQPDNAIAKGEGITSLLRPHGCWGAYGGTLRVRVTARHGWPAVPDDIKEATLLLANRLVLRKDSPEGVAASGEWGALRVSRWDPDVESLVGPFELPGLG